MGNRRRPQITADDIRTAIPGYEAEPDASFFRGRPNFGAALSHTFLVMLVPLLAGGLVLGLVGRRTHGRDVATAFAISSTAAPDAWPAGLLIRCCAVLG